MGTGARGFGSDHAASWEGEHAGELYERGRSGYPAELQRRLGADLGLGPGSVVVDVAAGTGKFTGLLLDAAGAGAAGPVFAAGAVFAVEPAEGMRRQLSKRFPSVIVVAAQAEALPFADASLDAVTVAQAFHWFRHAEALAEFARVIRPTGVLALVWNVDDPFLEAGPGPAGAALSSQVSALCEPYERLRPRPRERWKPVFEAADGWGPVETLRIDSTETIEVDALVDRVASRSFVLLLEPADRVRLLEEVRAVGQAAADGSGAVTLPMTTVMYWRRRT